MHNYTIGFPMPFRTGVFMVPICPGQGGYILVPQMSSSCASNAAFDAHAGADVSVVYWLLAPVGGLWIVVPV